MSVYTVAEVAKNCTAQNCWMIIHDKVYDVSKFLAEHPGGEEVLIEYAGKEASQEFDDVGHSMDAKELMKKYFIGDIVESERRKKTKTATPSQSRTIIAAVSACVAGFGAVLLYKGLQAARSSK